MTTPRLGVATLVVVLAAALTGCAASAPVPEVVEESASEAPPSASPSELPEETEDPLFTVFAKARSLDGTTLDLSFAAFEPIASTEEAASALVDDFVSACTEAGGRSISDPSSSVSAEVLAATGSSLMRMDYSITPEDQTLFAPVTVIAGIDNFATIAIGDGLQLLQSTENCLNRYQLVESGEGSFIADFESGSDTPEQGQWKFGSYGFTVPIESGATLESCRIELSPAAEADSSDVPGWDLTGGGGLSCGIGYTGE